MEKLILTYIGSDSWDRPVYKDENGKIFKDVNPMASRKPEITTCSSFNGEPDTPIIYIKKYENVKIKFIPERITW